jgi:hypothetical protein
MKKLILFAFSIALLLSGCISPDCTGNIQIYLKDQPIDIDNAEEILVTISEINVQKEDEGFLTLWEDSENPRVYDLLALRDKTEKIVDITLKEGTYTQIRLVVDSGEIVFSDEDRPEMIIPSSEVKIPVIFNIMEGDTIQITLDFEAEESIHVVSAGGSEQYILRPVIRVESISY